MLKSSLWVRPVSLGVVHRLHAHVACAGVVAGAGHCAGLRPHVAHYASRCRAENTGVMVAPSRGGVTRNSARPGRRSPLRRLSDGGPFPSCQPYASVSSSAIPASA
jgi:hypothetical protein